MKRIHLFEFEDLPWFPNWIRIRMTRFINAMHKILDTEPDLEQLLKKVLPKSQQLHIYDLCSGSGGPMPGVLKRLRKDPAFSDLKLTLSDLYPSEAFAKEVIDKGQEGLSYRLDPVDATNMGEEIGVRTMVCSMHHMTPRLAKGILKDALSAKQPICVFEISDNSFPKWLWWLAFPVNLITAFFVTPLVRPFTFRQFVFTYFIPVIPLFAAWDGAVSNARTYTLSDMDELLDDLRVDDYQWETGVIKNKSSKLYLLGYPK